MFFKAEETLRAKLDWGAEYFNSQWDSDTGFAVGHLRKAVAHPNVKEVIEEGERQIKQLS